MDGRLKTKKRPSPLSVRLTKKTHMDVCVGFDVSYEARAAASEQFSQVCPVHLFSTCDRAVIFIPFVLTSEQEVIYKGPCSHEVSPSPLLMSSWTE